MSIITNENQFTTITPVQFHQLNKVCEISPLGSITYCERECPQVFLDYTNDNGDTVNGEFDNSFSVYNGLCNISENMPAKIEVENCMYDSTTFEVLPMTCYSYPLCPWGYVQDGIRTCKQEIEVTPMPVILQAQAVQDQTTHATVQMPLQPAPLVRTGGQDTVNFALVIVCIALIGVMVWDSLTKR